jgi:antitoxin YefM
MNVATISDFRKNTKRYLDTMIKDNDILVISRAEGRSVVMMPLDRYNDMDTTDYLNSSKANREWLEKSMAELKAGKTIKKTMEELRQYE